jgi:hypothetical protein
LNRSFGLEAKAYIFLFFVQLVVYYYYIKSHLLKEVKMKEKKKNKILGIPVNLQPLGQSDASLS